MELAAILLFVIGVIVVLRQHKKDAATVTRVKKAKEEQEYRENLIDETITRLEILKKKAGEIDPEIGAKIVRTMMHDKTGSHQD